MDSREYTQSEIVKAIIDIADSSPDDDGSVTTMELCRQLGRGVKFVRDRLRLLIEEGKIEPCRTRRKSLLDNKLRLVNGYRLVGENENHFFNNAN